MRATNQKRSRHLGMIVASALPALLAGCAGRPVAGDDVGEISLDLTLAPQDALCAIITVARPGGLSVTRSISLSPSDTDGAMLSGLPAGRVTVSEQVFTLPCGMTAGHAATWISDPQTVTLAPGVPQELTFSLRRADASGEVRVINDFPTTQPTVTEFDLPAPRDPALYLAGGPDGNIWYGAFNFDKIGRLTPGGVVTEFPLPVLSSPGVLVTGPDGAIWYTASNLDRIGRITTDGTLLEFPLAAPARFPFGLAVGADGNLWFAETEAGIIGRITPLGVITEFPVGDPASSPQMITAGPDGNLWFSDFGTNAIGRMVTTGLVTEFPLPTPNSQVFWITTGPDGNIWFSEVGTAKIGRITTSGVITEFPMPAGVPADSIASGPDGNLWYASFGNNRIGRITPAGSFTEFLLPGAAQVITGPDGALWVAQQTSASEGRIARLTLP
jgi:virginiamycin B lyase